MIWIQIPSITHRVIESISWWAALFVARWAGWTTWRPTRMTCSLGGIMARNNRGRLEQILRMIHSVQSVSIRMSVVAGDFGTLWILPFFWDSCGIQPMKRQFLTKVCFNSRQILPVRHPEGKKSPRIDRTNGSMDFSHRCWYLGSGDPT